MIAMGCQSALLEPATQHGGHSSGHSCLERQLRRGLALPVDTDTHEARIWARFTLTSVHSR
jgi:hypothetical protein